MIKLFISPAKIMNLETNSSWNKRTKPEFIKDSEKLQKELKTYSPSDLEILLNISPKLSRENWERNQNWKSKPTKEESLQAVLAFKGEVYRGLKAENLSEKYLKYIDDNLYILSGLYGILKASDEIMLYRLEMGKEIPTEDKPNLYGFWSEKITNKLNKELSKEDIIVNLASKEYIKVIDRKKIIPKIIEIEFKDYKDNKLKSIVVYIKHARGTMVRWCAKNNIQNIQNLKLFSEDKYSFSEELSNENKFVFVR